MTERRMQRVRDCYAAYETGDRSVMEAALTDDFTFFSPPDPGIDRAAYFARCWPNAQHLERFAFLRMVADGDDVIVTYEATRIDGSRFRNTEVLTFAGDLIRRVEVYFGWNVPGT